MSVALGIDQHGLDPHGVTAPPAASSSDAAVTPNTSLAAIREAIVDAVNGLTPRSLSQHRYRYTNSTVADFREYAAENELTALRQFAIELEGWERVSSYDTVTQRRAAEFSLVLAYPHSWGTYAAQDTGRLRNRASLEDTAEQDLSQILAAVGIVGAANYPTAAVPVEETAEEPEVADGVTFAGVRLRVEFFYR